MNVINAANKQNLQYETLDGGEQVWMKTGVPNLVPLGVGGILNANVGRSEADSAKNYLQTFNSPNYSVNISGLKVMSTIVKGPVNPQSGPSPFCYVTSSQWKRNPESFDLWVDIIVGDSTNRINNWSDEREIVSY